MAVCTFPPIQSKLRLSCSNVIGMFSLSFHEATLCVLAACLPLSACSANNEESELPAVEIKTLEDVAADYQYASDNPSLPELPTNTRKWNPPHFNLECRTNYVKVITRSDSYGTYEDDVAVIGGSVETNYLTLYTLPGSPWAKADKELEMTTDDGRKYVFQYIDEVPKAAIINTDGTQTDMSDSLGDKLKKTYDMMIFPIPADFATAENKPALIEVKFDGRKAAACTADDTLGWEPNQNTFNLD